MDLKITKKRFEEHWAYDWIKYIAVVLVCIFVVSLFYKVTYRRLSDKEELRMVFFGTYVGELHPYNTEEDFNAYMKDLEIPDSDYLDYTVQSFQMLERDESFDAATISLDGEREYNKADIYILPQIDGNTYLDENGEIKIGAGYTFDMYVGMHQYFVPIDELIALEKQKGNPVAFELEQKLIANNYYYNAPSRSVDASLKKYDKITEVYTETENGELMAVDDVNARPVFRNYGIDLNKLDPTKTIHLIRDDADTANTACKYVLGVKKTSGSYSEAVCFINWFIDNYTAK